MNLGDVHDDLKVLEQEAGKIQVYEKSMEDSCHLGFASI
jgi:hypothetical protein